MTKECTMAGCEKPIKSKKYQLCNAHYMRRWRQGDVAAAKLSNKRVRRWSSRTVKDHACPDVGPDGERCSLDLRHVTSSFNAPHQRWCLETQSMIRWPVTTFSHAERADSAPGEYSVGRR